MKRIVMFLISASLALVVVAQRQVQQLADSVVKYQMKSGGWPKNQDWLRGVDAKEAKEWRKTGIGSTIDNGATTSEMETLAKAVAYMDKMAADVPKWADVDLMKERRGRYCEAFVRGLEYLLKMQYDHGGFPQFYPAKKVEDYSRQITFNDNAMVNVLKLLRDVARDDERFVAMGMPAGLCKGS